MTDMTDSQPSGPESPAGLFFTPGATYTRDLPCRAPELRAEFRCIGVGLHPEKGELRAFGFVRLGCTSPWVSAAHRPTEWSDGWVEYARPDRTV